MKKTRQFLSILFTVFLFSCTKENNYNNSKDALGTLTFLKTDGCGMMITLANGSRLEPVEWPANFTFIDGKIVAFCYEEKPSASICMAGKTVIIKSIRYMP